MLNNTKKLKRVQSDELRNEKTGENKTAKGKTSGDIPNKKLLVELAKDYQLADDASTTVNPEGIPVPLDTETVEKEPVENEAMKKEDICNENDSEDDSDTSYDPSVSEEVKEGKERKKGKSVKPKGKAKVCILVIHFCKFVFTKLS